MSWRLQGHSVSSEHEFLPYNTSTGTYGFERPGDYLDAPVEPHDSVPLGISSTSNPFHGLPFPKPPGYSNEHFQVDPDAPTRISDQSAFHGSMPVSDGIGGHGMVETNLDRVQDFSTHFRQDIHPPQEQQLNWFGATAQQATYSSVPASQVLRGGHRSDFSKFWSTEVGYESSGPHRLGTMLTVDKTSGIASGRVDDSTWAKRCGSSPDLKIFNKSNRRIKVQECQPGKWSLEYTIKLSGTVFSSNKDLPSEVKIAKLSIDNGTRIKPVYADDFFRNWLRSNRQDQLYGNTTEFAFSQNEYTHMVPTKASVEYTSGKGQLRQFEQDLDFKMTYHLETIEIMKSLYHPNN
ncbi:uncharacterized protein I206_107612 [Kwoniella pini CBS 10737]|uniref:Uncharacterized protein n=1 Tax=Kwoniella pini CBS 10737 TaxID=1296096 RepID=A0A1B9HXW4_9TREE|nr:uncharacterized protein I206_05945 [Kwoniella pini CBS 10737]OCF48078.1 hypothetical protein I206_05945 [Kwoniella pini CBS 10737]